MPDPADADGAVLTATKNAIAHMHALGIAYADLFSPLHDDGMADALRRLTIRTRGGPFGRRDLEAVSPPIFGRYAMLYSTDVDDNRRRFALRHGLGHVVAGHVTEISYLTTARDDHRSHEERVADLFALADLAPFWRLDELRKQRIGWRAIQHDVERVLHRHTIDWCEERVHDRATLRVALYRQYGL